MGLKGKEEEPRWGSAENVQQAVSGQLPPGHQTRMLAPRLLCRPQRAEARSLTLKRATEGIGPWVTCWRGRRAVT